MRSQVKFCKRDNLAQRRQGYFSDGLCYRKLFGQLEKFGRNKLLMVFKDRKKPNQKCNFMSFSRSKCLQVLLMRSLLLLQSCIIFFQSLGCHVLKVGNLFLLPVLCKEGRKKSETVFLSLLGENCIFARPHKGRKSITQLQKYLVLSFVVRRLSSSQVLFGQYPVSTCQQSQLSHCYLFN